MPLVVPLLRVFLVFLNVYETFKTFKPPPPSARRGGKPSERAMNQRKRDLKGCLAVWVVWCCYAVYERTFDRVVGVFLPFYSEIKSVFLLFLLLTRAKGAEPLFLHVLRPLVKPYAVVVDPTLELSRDLGDFFFALLQVPMDHILSLSWFSFWRTEEACYPGESTCNTRISAANLARANSHSGIPVLAGYRSAVQNSHMQNEQYGSFRSVSDNQYSNGRPSVVSSAGLGTYDHDRHPRSASITSLPAYSEHPSLDPPRYSQTLSRDGHQIWYPPASVHAGSDQEALASEIDTAPEYRSPEWRTYPAFPSAYPPTPLPTAPSLPSSVTMRSGGNFVFSDPTYPTIPEDEQDFDKPLEKQREEHPGSTHNSSNSNNNKILPGVNFYGEISNAIQPLDGDTLHDDSIWSSEAGLSEDDFGASLRTPLRSPEGISLSAHSSVDSLTSPLGYALPLRTKTSSDSLSSGSSSLAGRKRTHGAFRAKEQSALQPPQSRNATLRGRPVPLPVAEESTQSNASEDEDGRQIGEDDDSTNAKRRRTLDPLKRKSTFRPVTRGVGNARKGSLSSRNITRGHSVTTVSQATIRVKAGSVATNSSTIKARKSTLVSRQVTRGGPQGVNKSSSTSSSQSATLKGRA